MALHATVDGTGDPIVALGVVEGEPTTEGGVASGDGAGEGIVGAGPRGVLAARGGGGGRGEGARVDGTGVVVVAEGVRGGEEAAVGFLTGGGEARAGRGERGGAVSGRIEASSGNITNVVSTSKSIPTISIIGSMDALSGYALVLRTGDAIATGLVGTLAFSFSALIIYGTRIAIITNLTLSGRGSTSDITSVGDVLAPLRHRKCTRHHSTKRRITNIIRTRVPIIARGGPIGVRRVEAHGGVHVRNSVGEPVD